MTTLIPIIYYIQYIILKTSSKLLDTCLLLEAVSLLQQKYILIILYFIFMFNLVDNNIYFMKIKLSKFYVIMMRYKIYNFI
jgi:hypothetical protein